MVDRNADEGIIVSDEAVCNCLLLVDDFFPPRKSDVNAHFSSVNVRCSYCTVQIVSLVKTQKMHLERPKNHQEYLYVLYYLTIRGFLSKAEIFYCKLLSLKTKNVQAAACCDIVFEMCSGKTQTS